jgi:hypothetical protein
MDGWSGLLVARIRSNPFERTGSNPEIFRATSCALRAPGQRVVRATRKNPREQFVILSLSHARVAGSAGQTFTAIEGCGIKREFAGKWTVGTASLAQDDVSLAAISAPE